MYAQFFQFNQFYLLLRVIWNREMQTTAINARNGVQMKSAWRKTFSVSGSVLAPKVQNRCTRSTLKVNAIAAPMSTEVTQPESQPIFKVRQQFIPNMTDIPSISLRISPSYLSY